MPIKILIVEDERDSREVLSMLLKLEGYTVVTANDGLEALQQVEADRPDLILSDISMPNLDGTSLVKTLRNSPEYKKIPIMMLSAYDSGNLKNALNAGANLALRKPLDIDTLLRAIKEWAGESG